MVPKADERYTFASRQPPVRIDSRAKPLAGSTTKRWVFVQKERPCAAVRMPRLSGCAEEVHSHGSCDPQQGMHRRMNRAIRVLFEVVAVVGCCLPRLAGEVVPVRRVLILNEVGTSYPLTNLVDLGIRRALADSPYRIEFYREYMDTVLFSDPDEQSLFRKFYVQKYKNHKPDVVITVGSSPLRFMAETHKNSFPGVPIVFCFPKVPAESGPLDPEFTGVQGEISAAATVGLALRLFPSTRHLVVVGGVAPYDRREQVLVKQQLELYRDRLDIAYLTDVAPPALLNRLNSLPSDTVVLLTALGKDSDGNSYTADQSGPMVVHASNAPVFSLVDRYLNHGEIGGDVSSAIKDGQIVGGMALRILGGQKPQDIPVIKSATTYMFDSRALKHWKVKEKLLPAGSLLLNRDPTMWESYRWYVFIGLCLVALETVLIAGLLLHRARRKRAEKELDLTYDRLRLSVEAGRSVAWDFDVKTGQNYWFGDLQMMFGIPAQTYCGGADDFRHRVLPEDWDIVADAIENARQNREPYRAEFRVVRNDETVRWIEAKGKFYYTTNGIPERMLGIAVDVTERKIAEDSLATIGRRLIEAQEQERARIARELHDDINQQLALLAVELDQWNRSSSNGDVHSHAEAIKGRIMEISRDVQALAHQLHSSKLEYLGLATAARGFCREVSQTHGVKVHFTENGVPRNLQEEVSVCLFRVLQEAVQNAVKYSGADHIDVSLCGNSRELALTVRDAGVGFDLSNPTKSQGLGLVSMRERISLVKGTIAIKSKLTTGTEITAHVPLDKSSRASELSLGAA